MTEEPLRGGAESESGSQDGCPLPHLSGGICLLVSLAEEQLKTAKRPQLPAIPGRPKAR